MVTDPYAEFSSPTAQTADPYAAFASPTQTNPEDWQSRVKPIDLGGGRVSVQRDDGGIWFGPAQGNKGKAGWFDAQGMRLGDAPGKDTAFMDRLTNGLQQKINADRQKPIVGQIIPEQLGALGGGLVKGGMAAAQLGAHALGSNALDQPMNDYSQFQQQAFGDHPVMEAIGQAAPFITSGGTSAAPQALTTAQRVKAALQGIAKAAGTGAVAAPALTPETGVQSEGDYWTRKLAEAKTGAAVGGALGTAGETVGGVASKLKGKLTPEAQAIQNLGDKFGVRTMAPDLSASPGLNKAAVLAEQVPGSGMVSQRLAQQAEAKAAAQKLLDQHGIQGDASTAIQESLKNKFAQAGSIKNALYDDVAQAAGDRRIFLPKTFDALQAATKEAQASGLPENSVQKHIDTLASRLYQGRDEAGRLLAPAADTTFTGMQKTRSDLNDELSRLYKSGDTKGARILKGVKDAINQDMQDFATKSGDTDLASKWNRADQYYQKEYVPLKNSTLKAARESNEPDQIYSKFIQAGKGDRAQNFYNSLDPDGQAAVRSQIVRDAFEKASERDGVFSPAKFAQSLEKVKDASGVFFKGQDKFELDGFTNLMRHIQRAGQVAENPPTGQRLILTMLAGEGAGTIGRIAGHGPEAGVAALATGGTALASARALTKLFSSKAGKALLLAASDTKVGSTAMENLIEKNLPKVLAPSAASTVPQIRNMMPAAASTGTSDQIAQTEPK